MRGGGIDEICKTQLTAQNAVESTKLYPVKRYQQLANFDTCPEVIGAEILKEARGAAETKKTNPFKIDGYTPGKDMSMEPIIATVINFSYYEMVLQLESGRVLFLQRYPAAEYTGVKLTYPPSTDSVQPEEWKIPMDVKDLPALKTFWASDSDYQDAKKDFWKGGVWANKAIPGEEWCKGATIGSILTIIPTEQKAQEQKVSVSVKVGNTETNIGNGFLTDNPMPQAARDVIIMFEHDSAATDTLDKYYVLKTTRGTTDDMQNRVAIGAGEHLEPTDSKLGTNESIERAIKEELGIEFDGDEPTIVKAVRIPMGIFDAPGRDPRYAKYHIADGKTVGIDRNSVSFVDVVLVPRPNKEFNPGDPKEIKNVIAISLRDALKITDSKSFVKGNESGLGWGWIDHAQFVPAAIAAIKEYENNNSKGEVFEIKFVPKQSKK